MSHEEIWDDSALIDSWNDAVQEYKKYHSIAARGENVEEVLAEQEKQESISNGDVHAAAVVAEQISAEGHIQTITMELNDTPDPKKEDSMAHKEARVADETEQPTKSSPKDHGIPQLPPHLVGAVSDEGLKNLLMSWYYAGYYTGLYEGQQQAKTSQG